MTLESLTSKLVENVSWLYLSTAVGRMELGLIALTVMILLLLVIRWRRKTWAKAVELGQFADQAQSIGARLAAGNADHHQTTELEVGRLASFSKRDGKRSDGTTAKELRALERWSSSCRLRYLDTRWLRRASSSSLRT